MLLRRKVPQFIHVQPFIALVNQQRLSLYAGMHRSATTLFAKSCQWHNLIRLFPSLKKLVVSLVARQGILRRVLIQRVAKNSRGIHPMILLWVACFVWQLILMILNQKITVSLVLILFCAEYCSLTRKLVTVDVHVAIKACIRGLYAPKVAIKVLIRT